MLVREMHLGLDLELRKLNSNVFGSLEPQEKDLILNNAGLRLIKNRINPKIATAKMMIIAVIML